MEEWRIGGMEELKNEKRVAIRHSLAEQTHFPTTHSPFGELQWLSQVSAKQPSPPQPGLHLHTPFMHSPLGGRGVELAAVVGFARVGGTIGALPPLITNTLARNASAVI